MTKFASLIAVAVLALTVPAEASTMLSGTLSGKKEVVDKTKDGNIGISGVTLTAAYSFSGDDFSFTDAHFDMMYTGPKLEFGTGLGKQNGMTPTTSSSGVGKASVTFKGPKITRPMTSSSGGMTLTKTGATFSIPIYAEELGVPGLGGTPEDLMVTFYLTNNDKKIPGTTVTLDFEQATSVSLSGTVISPVPLPASGAMMLALLGCAGVLRTSRRARAAT